MDPAGGAFAHTSVRFAHAGVHRRGAPNRRTVHPVGEKNKTQQGGFLVNAGVLEPVDMDWLDKGVLGIEWSDGHKGVYPVRYLRQHCPCAACTDEMTGELRIKPDDIPLLIMLKDVEAIGRYALRFTWSDGHDTGIYSFTFLRRICQCDICQPVKVAEPKSKRLL